MGIDNRKAERNVEFNQRLARNMSPRLPLGVFLYLRYEIEAIMMTGGGVIVETRGGCKLYWHGRTRQLR
jgi:hypothetical protein